MKTKQKSFIFYDSDLECVEFLSNKQIGTLFKAIAKYRLEEVLPDFSEDAALNILFHQITTHMAMNEEKYKAICELRAAAAKKRWAKEDGDTQDDADVYMDITGDTSECTSIQDNTSLCKSTEQTAEGYKISNKTDKKTTVYSQEDLEYMQRYRNACKSILANAKGCYNDNDNDIVIDNVIVDDNENDALQAKKQKTKEENKKPLYDMSSVENFFLSAKKAQHQGSSL